MQLTCDRYLIVSNLNLWTRNLGDNLVPQILNYVLLIAREDTQELIAIGFDGEKSLKITLSAQVKKSGAICLPAKQLQQTLRKLQEPDVAITRNDLRAIIATKSAVVELLGVSIDEFIAHPELSVESICWSVTNSVLQKGIEACAHACAKDEEKLILTGVNLQFDLEKEVAFYATDSHQLALYNNTATSIELSKTLLSITIYQKTLYILDRVLTTANSTEIEFSYDSEPNLIKIAGDNYEIVSSCIAEDYPELSQIVPKQFKTQAIIERMQLIKNLELLSTIAKDKIIELELETNSQRLILSGENPGLGRGKRTLSAEIIGSLEELRPVYFNVSLILESLKKISSQKIKLLLNNWNKPISIEALESEGQKQYLVMPIQIHY